MNATVPFPYTAYMFANDGDDEPTLWRVEDGKEAPIAVMRRCESPEAFDLLMTVCIKVALS